MLADIKNIELYTNFLRKPGCRLRILGDLKLTASRYIELWGRFLSNQVAKSAFSGERLPGFIIPRRLPAPDPGMLAHLAAGAHL